MSGIGNIVTFKEDTNHVHNWHIDRPKGQYSDGHCECGAVRQFQNYDDFESKDWNGRERARERFNDSKK